MKNNTKRSALGNMEDNVFREDGTLKGFTLSLCTPQRGTQYWRLCVQFDAREPSARILRRNINNDFTEVFAQAVAFAAEYWGVSKRSHLYSRMMDSMEAHLTRYNLSLTVKTVTIVVQSLSRGTEVFDSEFIPRPSIVATVESSKDNKIGFRESIQKGRARTVAALNEC